MDEVVDRCTVKRVDPIALRVDANPRQQAGPSSSGSADLVASVNIYCIPLMILAILVLMTGAEAPMQDWAALEEAASRDDPAVQELVFGEHAVTWGDVQSRLYRLPEDEYGYGQPGDGDAYKMNYLRGLVMVQAAETEGVLGRLLLALKPSAKPDKLMAAALVKEVWELFTDSQRNRWFGHMACIRRAQKRRNKVVHERVTIGSTWVDYATGGGEWMSVISFLGDDDYDEGDLRRDLAIQQNATVFSLEVLHSLKCGDHSLEVECSTWW